MYYTYVYETYRISYIIFDYIVMKDYRFPDKIIRVHKNQNSYYL